MLRHKRNACFSTILVTLILVVSISAIFTASVQAKISDRVPVLVGFKDNTDAYSSIAAYSGQITYSYQSINAVAASVPRSEIETLRNNPNVAYVENDGLVYALAQSTPWGVTKISAPTVWLGGDKGTGIKVAVLDTGIDTEHTDLRVVGGASFVAVGSAVSYPYDDDHGHGTHCAGIIAALDNNIGVVGVAPEASLYAVKVLSRTGSGAISGIVRGIDWCIANGIQVISMSFGSSSPSSTLEAACNRAYNADIVLVAAAGNSGPGAETLGYPARYSSVISVAATDSNDLVASFSSRGTGLSVSAPGVSIFSTYFGNGYAYMSGTSMACPHTSGAVALILRNGPRTPAQVKSLLQTTAVDLGTAGYDTTYGYGRINAYAAAGGAPPTPASDFSISASPTSLNINAGASSTSTITATAINGFTGTISLSTSAPAGWTATFNPAQVSPNPGGVTSTATITVPSAANAGTYTVTVSGTNGTTTHSATITVNVFRGPSAPQTLTATAGNARVTLSWAAPASSGGASLTNYKIYRGTVSGGETLLTTVGNVLTYADTAVTNGQLYYYRVTAVNSIGESPNSNEASATPTAAQLKTMSVVVLTDRASYYKSSSGSSVVYSTVYVRDSTTLRPLLGATVTITIYNPDNTVAYTRTGTINSQGNIQFSYTLSPANQIGTYRASASVSMTGYQTGAVQRTFTVR